MTGVQTCALPIFQSSLKNLEINQKSAPTDDQVLLEIKKIVKQTKEAKAQFESGDRGDLAKKSEDELKLLEKYLPQMLSNQEIEAIVAKSAQEIGATTPADFGKLMGKAMAQTKGAADGSVVSTIVKNYLSK